MDKKKIMATLSVVAIISLIVGNVLDNLTYWIYSDIYTGIILAIVSYMLYRD